MAERSGDTPTYRYERKFVTSLLGVHEIDAVVRLNPALFTPIYHERFVNNVYLDSVSLANYDANVMGLAQRVKCRVRWYGDLFGEVASPVLELKIKRSLLGRKDAHPLPPFSHGRSSGIGDLFAKADLPDEVRAYLATQRPALVNRYRRRYYLSADRHFRLTVDTGLEFYRAQPLENEFLDKRRFERAVVVELKFDRGHEEGAKRIASRLPFRLSRSSKYVSGIDALYCW